MVAGIALPVGAIHEAEAGAADEHVQVHRMALAQHPFQFLGLLLGVGASVRLAPMVEPASPVFTDHSRPARLEFFQLFECALGFAGCEVHHRQGVGEGAIGEHVGAVGGEQQRFVKTGLHEQLAIGLHVGLVVVVGAVLVFDLYRDDRTPVAIE